MVVAAGMMTGLAMGLMLHAPPPGLAGGTKPDLARLLAPAPVGVLHPDEEGLDYRADHAAAMTQHRWKGGDYHLWRRDLPFETPWLWIAEDGGSLRRLGDGLFRLSTASASRDWFFETQCHHAGWPLFYCLDGRERQMSAPDLSTTIFGDVTYRRVLPTDSPASEN